MPTFGDLQQFLNANGIKNFQAREIAKRTLPPASLWARILPTLQVAERLRSDWRVGFIVVTSGYRDPAHNASVGGSSNSQHILFNALDIVPMMSATKSLNLEVAEKLIREDPLFPFMGWKVYSTFIHIDTRGIFTRSAEGATWDS